MTGTGTAAHTDWQRWQADWDRQQEWYLPDREERFRAMLDAVEALVGPEPKVLDLACGTGSISDRLLRRFPKATATGIDLDPALLTIARGHFADDPRAEFVRADLRDARWTDALPHRAYDAVLTSTALHWLRSDELRTLYGRIAGVVRQGGVFANADHMPDDTTPRINEAVNAFHRARREREKAEGRQDWADWWKAAAADPALAEPTAERFRIFGNPAEGDHADGETQPVAWHVASLRAAGFAEARTVWASAADAMVLALR
ncbi:methyltransferase domain-containing protein [Streptomyces sp. TRM43335]|uniref:Methyltransferase domain-containing protein n=1 Tax=Streptomyces taklimakanensis TaxID=2569853 RepID=A0A6G2BFQ8_9ACTN|nr:class I SAM-dependent methyltransferase [Streptomyces taklimakanensis]MTE20956.1 methyltransferase domain-containing protein [Streptomyces taklimakanensis]